MVKLVSKEVIEKGKVLDNPKFLDVRKWYNENLHPDVLDLNDEQVYKHIYEDGNWGGIFQFTAKGAQIFCKKIKPKNIVEIATATSIYRPGPLTAKVDSTYVEAKDEPDSVQYENKLLLDVLEETYGHIIFQEQIMKLGNVVGGLDLNECDKLRKAITKRSMSGKSKAKEEALRLEKVFVQGAVTRGMTEKQANDLYDKMAYFSGYGFNKTLHHMENIKKYTKDGQLDKTVTIGDIQPGDYLKSRDENTGEDVFVEVKEKHDHGILELYEFELEDGRIIRCTMDHKFRVTDGRMLPMYQIIEEKLDIVVGNVKSA